MKPTIILIAYNGDEWIPTCVHSLRNATADRLHLVVVDNAGNSVIDGLDLTAFDAEILRTPRPMGFADANNWALVNADRLEDVVLFLNQDTVSPAGWIDSCLEVLESNEWLGAISPLVLTYDGSDWDPSFLACLTTEQRDMLQHSGQLPPIVEVKNAPAAALLVRTDVLRRTGPFDPVFVSYYEDYDLCRRIRRLGYRIGFCSFATVRHYSGSVTNSEDRERRRMRQILRNRLLNDLRESNERRWRVLLRHTFADLPVRLARGLLGTPSSQPPLTILQAQWDMLKVGKRMISPRADASAWDAALRSLGWTERFSSPVPQDADADL